MISNIYSVSYAPGSSGEFIRTMITYMLLGEGHDIDFEDGSSHIYSNAYISNRYHLPLHGYIPYKGDRFKTIHDMATEEDCPIVIAGNLEYLNLDLYTRFLNSKHVVITVDIDDSLVTTANHYYKNLFFRKRAHAQYHETYLKYAEAGLLPKGLDSVDQLSSEQLLVLLELRGKDDLPSYIANSNEIIAAWPTDQLAKLFVINFKDIVSNPDFVIGILEQITGISASTAAKTQYNRYVTRQLSFRKEYIFDMKKETR